MRIAPLAALVFVLIALPAAAATSVTITPASPNTASFITATTNIQTICYEPAQVTVSGNVIRAVYPNLPCKIIITTPPFIPSKVPLGFLPAGTYTYELYAAESPDLLATTTFTVAAGPPPPSNVPAIDGYGLASLGVLFVLAGAIAVGRVA